MLILAVGTRDNLKIVLVLVKEIMLVKQLLPFSSLCSTGHDLFKDLRSAIEFLGHDGLRACSHVVSRAHAGVSGGDDRHSVGLVCRVKLGIPYSDLQRSFLDRLQQHRLRPVPTRHGSVSPSARKAELRAKKILPSVHDAKELAHKNRGTCVWIELTNPGNQHGPRNTTQEAQYV